MSHALGFRPTETNIQKILNPRVLQAMCASAYRIFKGQAPENEIGDFVLRDSTPTMLLYWSPNSNIYVVAVRGTVGTFGISEDWQANTTIPFNGLSNTDRWKKDDATMNKWLNTWIPKGAEVYATGHSLGGAICDELLRHGYVREAFTFNPAVQSQDFVGDQRNNRVYARGDPLYKLMGQFTVGAKLMPAESFLAELGHQLDPLYALRQSLEEHNLKAFNKTPDEILGSGRRKQNGLGAESQMRKGKKKKVDPREESASLLQGGVKQEDLDDGRLYIKEYSPPDITIDNIEKVLKVLRSAFNRIYKSATTAEKRRIQDYYIEIQQELEYFSEGRKTPAVRKGRIVEITLPLLERITTFVNGLKSEEALNTIGQQGKDLISDQYKEERKESDRITENQTAKANLEAIKIKKDLKEEAESEIEEGSPIKKSPKKQFPTPGHGGPSGKGRGDAPFPYSREGLTASEKARERAAYYRKHPEEKGMKRVVKEPKKQAEEVKLEEKIEEFKEVKAEPKAELTLADRARMTQAKQTLRKGIVRRLFRKLAEKHLWLYLYKKGGFLASPEYKQKEYSYDQTGKGFLTKAEWASASEQTYKISMGKWQDYLPQSAYDRIAKQVEGVKERVKAEAEKAYEEGPVPEKPRRKKLPVLEGTERMKTPNGYEWYVEDGKVFDLDGSRVGYKGMNTFKNLR